MRTAIFLCNNETMSECHTLQLFGTNEPYGRSVRSGDLCFLYNYSDNSLYGVWEAISDGGTHVPRAWGGRYPHQARIQQASQRIMSVPRPQIQRFLGDGQNIGRIHEGTPAQELLQHFASVYHRHIVGGEALRQTEQDYRTLYPADFFCDDGHRVRSQGEKIIDDWLHRHGVRHSYEPMTAIPGQLIPDFVVYSRRGDPIYIEYWGMNQSPVYDQRRVQKSRLYAQYMLPLIELYPDDLQIIDTALANKLRRLDVDFR